MEVLYLDNHFVAVNKPAGLLVHRSKIDRNETIFAMQLLRDRLGCRVYPVHRLDKPTSGVLVFALSAEDARRMMCLFSRGDVKKTYMAVVRGYSSERGRIDYALKEQLDMTTDGRAREHKLAQSAITSYRRLATIELAYRVGRYATSRYSLLQLFPETGRKHQIRRHMKHVFHPIVGDTTHGDGRHNRFFRAQFGCHRLLLAATRLVFKHPVTGVVVDIEAPLDEAFRHVLSVLGWGGVPQGAMAQDIDRPITL